MGMGLGVGWVGGRAERCLELGVVDDAERGTCELDVRLRACVRCDAPWLPARPVCGLSGAAPARTHWMRGRDAPARQTFWRPSGLSAITDRACSSIHMRNVTCSYTSHAPCCRSLCHCILVQSHGRSHGTETNPHGQPSLPSLPQPILPHPLLPPALPPSSAPSPNPLQTFQIPPPPLLPLLSPSSPPPLPLLSPSSPSPPPLAARACITLPASTEADPSLSMSVSWSMMALLATSMGYTRAIFFTRSHAPIASMLFFICGARPVGRGGAWR